MHALHVPGMLIKGGSKEIKMFLSIHNYLSDVQFMQIISGFSLTSQLLFKNDYHLINAATK